MGKFLYRSPPPSPSGKYILTMPLPILLVVLPHYYFFVFPHYYRLARLRLHYTKEKIPIRGEVCLPLPAPSPSGKYILTMPLPTLLVVLPHYYFLHFSSLL